MMQDRERLLPSAPLINTEYGSQRIYHAIPPPYSEYPPTLTGYSAPQNTTVVFQRQPIVYPVEHLPLESFSPHIILSCIATWCCFCPLGIIAFILAMVAQSNAQTDRSKAHCLGKASYVMSGIAVVMGIITIGVVYGILLQYIKHIPVVPPESSIHSGDMSTLKY